MKRALSKIFSVCLLSLAAVATANSAEITFGFDDVPTAVFNTSPSSPIGELLPYTSGNFILSPIPFSNGEFTSHFHGGSSAVELAADAGGIYGVYSGDIHSGLGGETFELKTINFLLLENSSLTVDGLDESGSVLATTVIAQDTSGLVDFSLLDPGFSAIKRFELYFTGQRGVLPTGGNELLFIDDLTINTVPIPGAVWLFLSALGVIGGTLRRSSSMPLQVKTAV